MKGCKKVSNANRNEKKAGVAVLISDKIDFITKSVTRQKEQYIMIKGSIQQDIPIVNIYASEQSNTQIQKGNIKRLKGRNGQCHNNSRGL